jgi:hypothetical protein
MPNRTACSGKTGQAKEEVGSRGNVDQWLKQAARRENSSQHSDDHHRANEGGKVGVDVLDTDLRENCRQGGECRREQGLRQIGNDCLTEPRIFRRSRPLTGGVDR